MGAAGPDSDAGRSNGLAGLAAAWWLGGLAPSKVSPKHAVDERRKDFPCTTYDTQHPSAFGAGFSPSRHAASTRARKAPWACVAASLLMSS